MSFLKSINTTNYRRANYQQIRLISLFLLFIITSGIAYGNTAIEAIQVLKRERGAMVINAICEMRGERGDPQPAAWIFLLNDPQSRSGLREIIISQSKIISDRTPIAEYSGMGAMPVLNTDALRFNSDDAFRITNAQAIKLKVGFDWLDYKLNRGDKGAIWRIHLSDYTGASVGNLSISAENGSILQPLKLDPNIRSSSRSQWVKDGGLIGHVNTTAKNIVNTTKKTMNKTVKSTEKAAHATKKTTLNAIGGAQEWLTGNRTIGLDQ